VRLVDCNVRAGLGFPLFGERRVDRLIEFPSGIVETFNIFTERKRLRAIAAQRKNRVRRESLTGSFLNEVDLEPCNSTRSGARTCSASHAELRVSVITEIRTSGLRYQFTPPTHS